MVVRRRFGGRPGAFARPAWAFASAILLGVNTGCGISPVDALQVSERLRPDDFRAPDAPLATPGAPIPLYTPERPRAPRVEIRTLSEAEARGQLEPVEVLEGAPSDPPPPSPTPAAGGGLDPLDFDLVDAKVGDLNGRPILASSWLATMAARLRAESARMPRSEWRAFAREEIRRKMVDDLTNELFLAEARASLTPEEKAGLRVFLQRFERDVVAADYGSRTRAEERMRLATGAGLEEAKREREKLALIREQLRKKVWDRVQVTSRDLQLEYERNLSIYSPPPQAVFRVIRLRTAEAEVLSEFAGRLASEPFADLAADSRNLGPDPQTRELVDAYENTEFFGVPALQEAAVGLAPGETAGPIEAGAFTYWIRLEEIQDRSRSLYDVQLELRDQITAQRREEETYRYLLKLFDRAGVRGVDELVARLVGVAEQWYYTPEAG